MIRIFATLALLATSTLLATALAAAQLKASESDRQAFIQALLKNDKAKLAELSEAGNAFARFQSAIQTVSGEPTDTLSDAGPDVAAASEAGVPEARFWVGTAHYNGTHGYARDRWKGVAIMEEAGDLGMTDAYFRAARIGEFVFGEKDERTIALYRKAAKAGIRPATRRLEQLGVE